MKICILGGGLSGLAAAHELRDAAEITVLEKDGDLGGCLGSYQASQTWIEKFYHHCFAGDEAFLGLLDQLGLSKRLEWLSGSTGYHVNGVTYPLTTPAEILRYPHLTVTDKARLALLTLRAKGFDAQALDDIAAEPFLRSRVGDRAYASFFEPLLRSKFGDRSGQVSAAWVISRIAIRSNRGAGGERLGYLNGGFQLVIDALASSIGNAGGEILTGTPAVSLKRSDGSWQVNGSLYDAVISTIPPPALAAIGGPVLPDLPYQGAACLVMGLDREVTGGIYWVNMKDPAPYGAVIGHTNMVPHERYGEHIVYLASYFKGAPAPDLAETMLEDFRRRFGVAENEVHWHHLTVEPWAGPVYTTGYAKLIVPPQVQGLYLAGMFSTQNYPERSMEGSVRAGQEAASLLLEDRHE